MHCAREQESSPQAGAMHCAPTICIVFHPERHRAKRMNSFLRQSIMVFCVAKWRIRVMSEYQRYEFMTIDRPLTRAQLDEVNELSSHIEASSTHAVIEYHWSGFKHDPIKVLYKFFDGFLYWANWGSPELA